MEKRDPMGSNLAPSAQDAHIEQVQTIEVPLIQAGPNDMLSTEKSTSPRAPTEAIVTPLGGYISGSPMQILAPTIAGFDPIADATIIRTAAAATDSQQQSVERAGRTASRRLPLTFAALLVVLVLAVASVPLLQMLSSAQHPRVGLTPTLTPTAPSSAPSSAQGTSNRHAFDWIGQTQNAAEIAYVNQMLSHMTLDEKIGQMIMIEFEESQMTDGLAYEISHYHVGSVILYAYNVLNPDQTRSLDQAIQANAKIPVLISTDQEGGSVNRLASILGPLPSAAEVSATNNPNFAKQRGEQDAKTLYSLGINANLAPVVDVLNTPTGGAIGDRAFGSTPQQVTKMAGAYLTGLQESHQVVGTLKHFPGLGAVEQDPHKTLTTLNRDLGTLEQVDWAPYASLIATGQVEMVMVTHVVMPAVDPDRPASLSKPMITGILRDKLRFNGVVMTDGIYMKALAAHYSFDQIVLYAVEAGVDVISSTYSLSSTNEAFNVIKNAVLDGTLSQKQIDDSVRRILLTKMHYGMLAMPSTK